LKQAAAWVDRVGVALVFPKDDLVLPSLWEAAGGVGDYAIRDADGKFVDWHEPMNFVWPAKSELPERNLVCGGNHIRGRASLIALDLVAAFVAVAPRRELDEIEHEVVELVRDEGPSSTRELPDVLPQYERKHVRAAIDRLEKAFVLTHAGREQTDRWPATIVDLVERRYRDRLDKLPSLDDARTTLARRVLSAAGELTAEDLRGAFGWRKADCVAALESTRSSSREAEGFAIWTATRGALARRRR
jgi:hypothetical protein